MSSDLARAWDNYCSTLKEEGERVLQGSTDAASDDELAEALRCVGRLGAMALVHRLDFNDPDFPVFFRALDDKFKYAGPDAYITYLSAALRGDATYRITGNHQGRNIALGPLWSDDLAMDADGSFEVTLSSSEVAGSAIRLDPDLVSGRTVPEQYPMAAGGVTVRMYYEDPGDQRSAGELRIERIDDDRPDAPAPLTAARLAEQVESAAELLAGMAPWWLGRARRIREENEPNVLGAPSTRPPGVPGFMPPSNSPINYGVCCWELGPGEALLVESELPEAQYWSFQLYTPWWESPDLQNRQTSISHKHAHIDADGRFRAVLAAEDPGTPNWLDTAGMRRGFLFYRWVRPQGSMPTPVATPTTMDRVSGLLPADHPVLDRAARREQLAGRRAFFARRFQR